MGTFQGKVEGSKRNHPYGHKAMGHLTFMLLYAVDSVFGIYTQISKNPG